MKTQTWFRNSLLALLTMATTTAQALSLDWTGHYRFEYTQIESTTLGNPKNPKAYFLHNLVLSPRVIAADGIEVVAQFSVLGNANYPGSMAGQSFGIAAPTAPAGSSVMGRNAGVSNLEVRQLYLSYNQEYGQLIAGRAPVEFGLGMTYNAGNGPFDVWGDTHDLVGYKFVVGNLSFMPMIGKPYDPSLSAGGDVTDVMLDITYNNEETESLFAIFSQQRTSGDQSNDAGSYLAGTQTRAYNVRNVNLLIGRGWESFKFKLEAGFADGGTGMDIGGEEQKANGYGIVTELEFPRQNSNWDWKLRAGVVSGDNPTSNNFEGYALHRNYNVAFLMFNHPMGGYDLFRSYFQRQRSPACTTAPCAPYANDNALDEEVVSNTIFLNPSVNYKLGDRWSLHNNFVYAQLQVNSSTVAGNDISKDLGFEWDIAAVYQPHPRFQWVNQVGLLFPGSAWKEGNVDRDAAFTYGFQTKAAISF
ncbi:MAG: hypothetical protein KF767_02140 [Bdellovibrionaceae bacterium]|nr:hypothetical protein [Pseudobdellovibrionaceae bacterium]